MDRKMQKIILVEDDATMLSLLHTLLQMEGFDVVSLKEDTLEGIYTQMQSEQPALALVDVHLRLFSGFDLLKKVKATESLNNMKVLMSSGMDFRSECSQAGADGFILKPYMPDDLIQKIRTTIKP
jgi:DNA-binding response OmpR family regulator